MKQVAKKTLGVAAMSAAAVMAGSGAASALPLPVEGLGAPTDMLSSETINNAGRAVGPVSRSTGEVVGALPLEETTQHVAPGLKEPVGVAQEAISGTLTGTPLDRATDNLSSRTQKTVKGKSSAGAGGGMIGGIPLGKALPVGGSR